MKQRTLKDHEMPRNGQEAVSCMRCYLDMQGLSNMIGNGELDPKLINKYTNARKVAIKYKLDVSDFPEQLRKDEMGNIGVIGV